MDTSRLVDIGTKIVSISTELKTLQGQRDAFNKQIAEMEAELAPLLAEHAEIIASVLPTPVKPVVPVQFSRSSAVEKTDILPEEGAQSNTLKRRVVEYLQKHSNSDEGVSATDVAELLKIDAAVVRSAMLELRNAR